MSTPLKLIGVTGTASSGKDTVTELLAQLFNLQNMSSGDMVRAITRQVYNLPPDFSPVRDQLFDVANYVRTEIDPAAMVKLCILQARAQEVSGAVISGLRTVGEAEAVRAAGGIIIGVDADPKVRYERMSARGRDAETQKTFEEFLKQDEYENKGLSDSGPNRGIRAIIDSADLVIDNTKGLEELKAELQAKVTPLLS